MARDCTCLGTCRGAEGLGAGWKCALVKEAHRRSGGGQMTNDGYRRDPPELDLPRLDSIVDTVLKHRPKARSKPAVQRKRRKTILEKKRAKEK
jgi:hypothetical protein